MTEVAVVDYGLGNLFNLMGALERVGANGRLIADAASLARARTVILPGVGAFAVGMRNLCASGMNVALRAAAEDGARILGICLGMQLLMRHSDEGGDHQGLGLLEGDVVRLEPVAAAKVPHIGWNTLHALNRTPRQESPLLRGIPNGTDMYFAHSFCVKNVPDEQALAVTEYAGDRFVSVAGCRVVAGCQFHPERSGEAGIRMLHNFLTAAVPV